MRRIVLIVAGVAVLALIILSVVFLVKSGGNSARPAGSASEEALFKEAQAEQAGGNLIKARDAYQRLIRDYPQAKFVMENIGDARQASLLEEIIKLRNPQSFIAGQAEKLLKSKLGQKIGTSVERAIKLAK